MAVRESLHQDREAHEGETCRGCAECGRADKSLTAPKPNARGYTGPMYCLSCNPRFSGGIGARAMFERMGA